MVGGVYTSIRTSRRQSFEVPKLHFSGEHSTTALGEHAPPPPPQALCITLQWPHLTATWGGGMFPQAEIYLSQTAARGWLTTIDRTYLTPTTHLPAAGGNFSPFSLIRSDFSKGKNDFPKEVVKDFRLRQPDQKCRVFYRRGLYSVELLQWKLIRCSTLDHCNGICPFRCRGLKILGCPKI